jgi:hypothetical protein
MWREGTAGGESILLVGMSISTATMEITKEVLQKTNHELPQHHFWAYIWRNVSEHTQEIPTQPHLLHKVHNSQALEAALVPINR